MLNLTRGMQVICLLEAYKFCQKSLFYQLKKFTITQRY